MVGMRGRTVAGRAADGSAVRPETSTPGRSTDTGMPVTSFRAPNRAALAGCPALVNEAPEGTMERRTLMRSLSVPPAWP